MAENVSMRDDNIKPYETYHERKVHTMPDFPYNIYPCSIPLDFPQVQMHWQDEMEIIAVKKGKGVVWVDLVDYEVEEGQMVFILPGQLHSIEQKEGESMEYENIIFHMEMLETTKHDKCTNTYLQPLLRGKYNIPTHITQKNSQYQSLYQCIEHMDTLCEKKQYGYELGIKGELFWLFSLLMTMTEREERKAKRENRKHLDRIKQIIAYTQENYGRQITIEEMAQSCYCSKSHFMKVFKESMGMGFVQYLNDYRLNIAYQLLQGSDDTILEIAGRVGFDSLSYFNRIFKRKYGITPGQVRKSE